MKFSHYIGFRQCEVERMANDYGTNQLMVNYYQRLKNNVGRSEALRQTQLEMRQKPEFQHPYYWAVFILSGDWTAMGQ
jgi:CHAT domain-containing protein